MAKSERLHPKVYSDAAFVEGLVRKDPVVQRDFYVSCMKYFNEHYRGVLFAADSDKDDIFQDTFITLWENIENGKIRLIDGELVGKGGQPFRGSLYTYMMSIARVKNLERARDDSKEPNYDSLTADDKRANEPADTDGWYNDSEDLDMLSIISDCIAGMSTGCSEILTKFYIEKKKLDDILSEMKSYSSKDALKTAKNKCLSRLREAAVSLYEIRRNM